MLSSSARDETTSPPRECQCACDTSGRGAAPSVKVIRQTRTRRAGEPADELSGQGSVWERTATAAVAVMGDGDGRLRSTNADTSLCTLEMSDSSRDCHPSRTSHAGPAAPGQRPCTSTNTPGPWASTLVHTVPSWNPRPLPAIRPIPSTTMGPPIMTRTTTTPSSGFHPSFHACSTTPPHLRPHPFLTREQFLAQGMKQSPTKESWPTVPLRFATRLM